MITVVEEELVRNQLPCHVEEQHSDQRQSRQVHEQSLETYPIRAATTKTRQWSRRKRSGTAPQST